MAKKTSAIGQYNATIAAIKKSTGVSHREAQQAYRGAAVRMGRAPRASEVAKSRAVKEEARTAGAKIAAAKRRDESERERRIERSKVPTKTLRERDRLKVTISPPERRGKRTEPQEGPGGAAGAGGRKRQQAAQDYPDWVGLEPPDDIGGEEDESPDGKS